MLKQFMSIAAAFDLTIPVALRRPVGIIGAGSIVDVAHLPAYRGAGLEVVAIHDRHHGRALDVAARHSVVRVHESIDDMLDDPEIAVIDIAIPAAAQAEIALRAMDAGKDVLCQKPLALDVAVAQRIVDRSADLGRKVAVQQQLRYEEGVSIARAMLREGWIGEPTMVSFMVDTRTDFAAYPWLVDAERLELLYHSIHYLDAIRSLIGEPVGVFGTQSRRPGQIPVGETRSISTLIYSGDLRAFVHANHENLAGENRTEYQIDGTDGTIRGTLGPGLQGPYGRPSTLEVCSRVLPTDGWLSYPVTTRWIPDAFVGPMRSLLAAIAEDGEAETSARDNIRTLMIVDALYRSAETGNSVYLQPGSDMMV